MSNVTSTSRPRATLTAGSNPVIYNVSCASANTEYSQVLNSGVKKFIVRVRGLAIMRIAFDSGETNVEWLTVPTGCSYCDDGLSFNGVLYFQTNKASQIVEILEWT